MCAHFLPGPRHRTGTGRGHIVKHGDFNFKRGNCLPSWYIPGKTHIVCCIPTLLLNVQFTVHKKHAPNLIKSLDYERKPKVHITETFQSEEKYISKPFTLQ